MCAGTRPYPPLPGPPCPRARPPALGARRGLAWNRQTLGGSRQRLDFDSPAKFGDNTFNLLSWSSESLFFSSSLFSDSFQRAWRWPGALDPSSKAAWAVRVGGSSWVQGSLPSTQVLLSGVGVGRPSILLDFQFTALLEMWKDNCICSGRNMLVLLFSCLEIKFPSIMSIFSVDLLPSSPFLWCVSLLRSPSGLCLHLSKS